MLKDKLPKKNQKGCLMALTQFIFNLYLQFALNSPKFQAADGHREKNENLNRFC